jgi:hypothetical protein
LAETQDRPAVVAVGDLADHQRERKARNELRQAHQSQIERAAGELIDLPADRHRLHLKGDGGSDARPPEQREGRMAQGGG